ncbi:membrane protein [Planotetraspora thailandica]|uniref:Membrane protein n=1 Tax=Planotetraspora thailandica TaxID=487172 RepID=A0A8J3V1Y4_9ACTN|nr:VIT1/CCC1 transporter family protein [Planotetraspora thailandica]GII54012.1 membrane protein [Planotetraspora thailandica]
MTEGGSGARAEIHHQHRDVTGGWLRPTVFGAMDGLVSNFALIAGVAGGTANTKIISLAGVAGLAAGAFSMAGGEYVSVASQRELAEAEIDIERRELERNPQSEEDELTQLYVQRGVEADTAREVARQISRNPEQALAVHTRAELGVDPQDLPSPVLAAVSSFLSFGVGALIPLFPYLIGLQSLWIPAAASMAALFAAGAVVSRVTARTWWFSGLRQLVVGGVAACLTWGLGTLIGSGAL